MSKCNNCKIEILDASDKCPFCKCVLSNDGGQGVNTYPDARVGFRRSRLVANIILFLSIVVEFVLFLINDLVTPDIFWCAIVGMILLYANVVMRLAIIGQSGYQFKTIALVVLGVAVLFGIDFLTGYKAWSLNFVWPICVLLLDASILLLMIINHRNWQSYMMTQLLMIVLSGIPVIFLLLGIVTSPYLPVITLAVSILIFLGTLIIGDQRARTEMKRRFHI